MPTTRIPLPGWLTCSASAMLSSSAPTTTTRSVRRPRRRAAPAIRRIPNRSTMTKTVISPQDATVHERDSGQLRTNVITVIASRPYVLARKIPANSRAPTRRWGCWEGPGAKKNQPKRGNNRTPHPWGVVPAFEAEGGAPAQARGDPKEKNPRGGGETGDPPHRRPPVPAAVTHG